MQLITVTNGDRILIISVLPEAIASATVSPTIAKAPRRIFIVLFQNTSPFVHLVSGVVLKYGKDSQEYEMKGIAARLLVV
ncbi:MAG: hypothetical protein V7L11_03065 [Nostoc sp.]|uniref:hypothetical protein n=1 Tax=Nostoc sp. TaxID=1180 RepID=UPI002FF7CED3